MIKNFNYRKKGNHFINFVTGFDVPDADAFVKGARCNYVGLRVEFTAKDVAVVSFESLHTLAGAEIPHFQSLVIGGRAKQSGVGAPTHV